MIAEMVRYTDDRMGLDEAIAAYLAACDIEGKSPRPVDAYAETLGMFHAVCRQRGLPQRVAEFRPAHVYTFLKVIAESGVSLGTRHRRFRETRAFFSWCLRMGACAGSPFTGIPNVKVEQKVIQPLSQEDIQALLAVCDSGDEFGCRNRAIILLFLDTGMRYAELHQLTLADVSWAVRRIHICHGRGRKQRVAPDFLHRPRPANVLARSMDRRHAPREAVRRLAEARVSGPVALKPIRKTCRAAAPR